MKTKQTAPKHIDEYIAGFPGDVQEILQKLMMTISEVAPDAEETIKYRIPTFTLKGNLIHFAAYKNHIGFYPTPTGIEKFKDELSVWERHRGFVSCGNGRPPGEAAADKGAFDDFARSGRHGASPSSVTAPHEPIPGRHQTKRGFGRRAIYSARNAGGSRGGPANACRRCRTLVPDGAGCRSNRKLDGKAGAPNGIVPIEFVGGESAFKELTKKLGGIAGVGVKQMVFDHS